MKTVAHLRMCQNKQTLRRNATVTTSWPEARAGFKSPLRVVGWFLHRSREKWAEKCRERKRELDEKKRELERCQEELREQQRQLEAMTQQLRRLENKVRQRACEPILLPPDPPVGTHGYGARMISLAVNVARVVGMRGASRTLEVFFDWLGVSHKTPCPTTIRTWLQRAGIAAMNQPLQRADDWVWMADHSIQIGPEKVLVVLGIRASQLPAPGETLRHEHVRVLTVRPGTNWKQEKVEAIYRELAEEHGAPRALLCDGAAELRKGAESLRKLHPEMIVLHDFKHKAANLLKRLIGKDKRHGSFGKHLIDIRCKIQQTELAYLIPPKAKQKARFMNLETSLNWATMILWLLDHPKVAASQGVSAERLEEKLGSLRSFAEDISRWNECQRIVNEALTFINTEGLTKDAVTKLRAKLASQGTRPTSQELIAELLDFVGEAQEKLKPGERLPMSTEILESSFSLYKQLERKHAKGGFTGLLACFPALLRRATPQTIEQAFASVSVKDARSWVRDNLGRTLVSKRHEAYSGFRKASEGATNLAVAT